ncbi:MAG TPA: septum formation initiator family protein [bacterium]|nr:septum formation initiator family protein [bacterium]
MRAASPKRRRPSSWATSLSLQARVLAIVIGCLAGWILVALVGQYVRTYALEREAARLERHRQELLAENATLDAEIHRLRTDDQYIERLAREQLGMLRPGEMELVIVPRRTAGESRGPGAAPPGAAPPDSNALPPLITRIRDFLAHLLDAP